MAKPDKAGKKAERDGERAAERAQAKVDRENRRKDAAAAKAKEKEERKAAREAEHKKITATVSYDGADALHPSPASFSVMAKSPAHSLKGRALDYYFGEDAEFGADFELHESSGELVPKKTPVSEYGDPVASFVLVRVA